MRMRAWLDTDQTGTQSTHMNTDKTNSFPLLPSLAEQDGHLRVTKYTHTHMQTNGESLAKENVRKEFSKETGQAVLIWHRA